MNRVISRSPLLGRICFTGSTDLSCFSYQASQPCHRNTYTGWSPASWQSHIDKPLFSLNSTAGPYAEKLFTCMVFSHRKHLKILCFASFLSKPHCGLAWKKRNGHTFPSPPQAWAASCSRVKYHLLSCGSQRLEVPSSSGRVLQERAALMYCTSVISIHRSLAMWWE